jgi:hypothetical protein
MDFKWKIKERGERRKNRGLFSIRDGNLKRKISLSKNHF